MYKLTPLLLAAAALAACSSSASTMDESDPNYAEMEELKAWGKQLKADDPDTARALVKACATAGSFFSAEGKLEIARCMKRKYDEGERAEARSW